MSDKGGKGEQLEYGVFREEAVPPADSVENEEDEDQWLDYEFRSEEELSQSDSESVENKDDESSRELVYAPVDSLCDAFKGLVEQASFESLPDDIFKKIFNLCTRHSRLKLKLLNKAIDQRCQSFLSFQNIQFQVNTNACHLTIDEMRTHTIPVGPSQQMLVKAFRRWSANIPVRCIVIFIEAAYDDIAGQAINALCQFNADKLEVHTNFDSLYLDFPTLLIMAGNIREVIIDHLCPSIEGVDLAIVWKSLVDGGCKMESLSLKVKNGVGTDFIKAAFHIDKIKENGIPRTIEYRNHTSNTCKIFSSNSFYPEKEICILSDGFVAEIIVDSITFKKIDAEEIIAFHENFAEVKLNHVYEKFDAELLS